MCVPWSFCRRALMWKYVSDCWQNKSAVKWGIHDRQDTDSMLLFEGKLSHVFIWKLFRKNNGGFVLLSLYKLTPCLISRLNSAHVRFIWDLCSFGCTLVTLHTPFETGSVLQVLPPSLPASEFLLLPVLCLLCARLMTGWEVKRRYKTQQVKITLCSA